MKTLLLLALVLPSVAAAQEANSLERYDLRPVVPSFDDGGWEESLVPSLASPYDDDLVPRTNLEEMGTSSAPEVVLDVVTRILGDEMLRQGRVVALDGESNLVVLGPASMHQKIRAVLAQLAQVFGATESVRLDVLTLNGAAGEPVASTALSPSEADAQIADLVARGALHRSYELELSPGRTAVVDQTQRRSAVLDYNVEIAQGAVAFDPVVWHLEEGLRLFARGSRGPGGLTVSLALHDTRLPEEPTQRPLAIRAVMGSAPDNEIHYVTGPGWVDDVELETHALAFTTVVPRGGAVAFSTLASSGADARQAVFFLRAADEARPSFHETSFGSVSLLMLDAEAFGAPTLGSGGRMNAGAEAGGMHPSVYASLWSEPSPFLADWLQYRFSVYRQLGPWAVIVTDPSWDGRAAEELRQLAGSVATRSTSTVSLGVDLVDSQGGRPFRLAAPVLQGTRCAGAVGRSLLVLADYDVEVAHFASVPDPVIAPLFDGLCVRLGVSKGDTPVLEAWGVGQRVRRPIQGRDATGELASPFHGNLDQPVVDRISFDESRSVARGATMTLGSAGSKPSDAPGLRVEVGLR